VWKAEPSPTRNAICGSGTDNDNGSWHRRFDGLMTHSKRETTQRKNKIAKTKVGMAAKQNVRIPALLSATNIWMTPPSKRIGAHKTKPSNGAIPLGLGRRDD